MSDYETLVRMSDLENQVKALHEALAGLGGGLAHEERPQSSVEIARNSKGATWTVKVYHQDPETARNAATRLYDELAALYREGGNGG